MVLDANNRFDAAKTTCTGRRSARPRSRRATAASSPEMYCQDMIDIQTPFLAANQALLETG